jgi:hypothetical protein
LNPGQLSRPSPSDRRHENVTKRSFSLASPLAILLLDHIAGLIQLPPEEMHSWLGRAILRHPIDLADRGMSRRIVLLFS